MENYFLLRNQFKISKNSAFVPYKKINGYIVEKLIESGEITLANKNKILTPCESLLWLDSLKIKCVDGNIKIISNIH